MKGECENVPQIRFEGFTAAWEQRKLGELYDIYSGQTPFRGDQDNFQNPTTAWIKTTDLNNASIEKNEEDISDKALEKLRLLPIGSVLVAMYGGFNQIGRTGMLTYPATINQAISALSPISEIDSYFLITELNHRVDEWKIVAASSRKDPNITKKDVENFVLKYPSLTEQIHIGTFFRTLDSIIALYRSKLEGLWELKKGYLQLMFPQIDECVPRVRFAGFTKSWEQRKFKDISSSYSGGTPSVSNPKYYGGNIPFIRSAEINSCSTELLLTEEGLKNSSAKMVSKGIILYALYGATSGEVGVSQIDGAINQAILAIKPNDGYDAQYLMQWLRSNKQNIVDTFLQGGQGNLSGSIVKDLDIVCPLHVEQTAIGNFFRKLDDNITMQQIKLDQLNQLKVAYLQKMFM